MATPPPDARHLRLVPRLDLPMSTAQVADMPGAYQIRRGGPAEAIIHRGNTGDWYLMYGFDPNAPVGSTWQRSAVLSGRFDNAGAALVAVELVTAAELVDGQTTGVRCYPNLLGRCIDAGEAVAALARLHSPDRHGNCAGDGVPEGDRIDWTVCATVLVLAGSVGIDIR